MFMKNYIKDYLNIESNLPKGVILNRATEDMNDIVKSSLDREIFEEIEEKSDFFVHRDFNGGMFLYLPKNIKIDRPIMMKFNIEEENSTALDQNLIVADIGSEATVIIDYSSDDEITGFHNGYTTVYARENSIVNIVKIQRMNDNSKNIDSNLALVKGRGTVNWISVELGSKNSASNYTTFLESDDSEGNLYSIYLGSGVREIDLEYSMIHRGARSISKIDTKGVLLDRAKKVFNGKLDFKRGARHSKGEEEEYVILLDPTVKSDSIPALLCEEDDVEGAHAVSAGQINEDKLFYLMSRGLDERESKKLIVEASFRPIIDKIPIEDLRREVKDEIERRLIYA
ncbi:Fe-S cluster assembly protein SufD [Tissierellaceae bacterium HCP3S3_D8]